MRLTEILDIIKQCRPNLSVKHVPQPKTNLIEVREPGVLFDALEEMRPTGVFGSEFNQLDALALRAPERGDLVVAQDVFNTMNSAIASIRGAGDVLVTRLAQLSTLSDHTIAVLLPSTPNLSEVGDLVCRIGKMLEQAVSNEHVNGNVRSEGFDRGSSWIYIALGSLGALKLVKGIVKLLYDIERYRLDLERQRQGLEMGEFSIELLRKYQSEVGEKLIMFRSSQLEELLEKCGVPASENELKARIDKSVIKELDALLRMGVEFHSALPAPDKDAEALPAAKQLRELLALPDSDNQSGDVSESDERGHSKGES